MTEITYLKINFGNNFEISPEISHLQQEQEFVRSVSNNLYDA